MLNFTGCIYILCIQPQLLQIKKGKCVLPPTHNSSSSSTEASFDAFFRKQEKLFHLKLFSSSRLSCSTFFTWKVFLASSFFTPSSIKSPLFFYSSIVFLLECFRGGEIRSSLAWLKINDTSQGELWSKILWVWQFYVIKGEKCWRGARLFVINYR
jgi:hypothetical protein